MRVLLVDDEPLVRQGIKFFLANETDMEIIAECENGSDAVDAICNLKPDLVFLDVQMPELDGFSAIEKLDNQKMPLIIFVTAYDKYAVKAFEINALDYLLKPFDKERFEETLRRARQQVNAAENGNFSEHFKNLINQIDLKQEFLERIVIKSSGRIFFLPVESIDYITAADNYVSFHVGKKEHLVRKTMQEMEDKLNPNKFLRIRHSTIVNISRILELSSYGNGEFLFTLNDGTRLISSRNYRQKLNKFLEG